MEVIISRGRIIYPLAAPPSKSYGHRMLICSALAEEKSLIHGISDSEDMAATTDCITALGAECIKQGSDMEVCGMGAKARKYEESSLPVFNCRESGSTLRFFIPIALLCCGGGIFRGTERLMERGVEIYEDLFRPAGISVEKKTDSIKVTGSLKAGHYSVPGDVSSQFISGLMFVLPLLEEDSTIQVTGQVESRAYIDITIDVLKSYGVIIEETGSNVFSIKGGQHYRAGEAYVEGDWSNAAYLYALRELEMTTGTTGSEKPSYGIPAPLGTRSLSPAGYYVEGEADREKITPVPGESDIEIFGLNENSIQGDRICVEYLEKLREPGAVLDISDCPDLGPVLFAVAAVKNGARFIGTRRLRIKESDRVQAMCEEIAKTGKECQVSENEVVIPEGLLHFPNEPFSGHNDHRIVMADAVLATMTGGRITGAEAVRKSYPDFFDMMKSAGLKLIIK